MATKKAGTLPGGYTDWEFPLDSDAQKVFDAALKGIMGVGYQPLAFAKQVIAGYRYAFLVLATATTHPVSRFVAVIHIIAPLQGQGQPHVEEIKRIPQTFGQILQPESAE